jgi:hypothetical protein
MLAISLYVMLKVLQVVGGGDLARVAVGSEYQPSIGPGEAAYSLNQEGKFVRYAC